MVIVYLLTALAVLDLVLTRMRMTQDGAAGRALVGRQLLDVHTRVGAAAVVVWLIFLIGPEGSLPGNSLVGLLALALWWVTALAGLLILSRWLPSSGKRAAESKGDSWTDGPGLSILAHAGMLAGVLFFTWAYATSAV